MIFVGQLKGGRFVERSSYVVDNVNRSSDHRDRPCEAAQTSAARPIVSRRGPWNKMLWMRYTQPVMHMVRRMAR